MKGDWSDWMFFVKEQLISIPGKSGVYEFRCTDGNGHPMLIDRLNGKDKEGIIYIGSSEDLKKRINGFWKTIEQQDRSRHAAGWTYCSFGYNDILPPNHLQFRFKMVSNITGDEFDLLLEYRRQFMDLPPLNSNRPPYPRDWKTRMKEIFGRIPLE